MLGNQLEAVETMKMNPLKLAKYLLRSVYKHDCVSLCDLGIYNQATVFFTKASVVLIAFRETFTFCSFLLLYLVVFVRICFKEMSSTFLSEPSQP